MYTFYYQISWKQFLQRSLVSPFLLFVTGKWFIFLECWYFLDAATSSKFPCTQGCQISDIVLSVRLLKHSGNEMNAALVLTMDLWQWSIIWGMNACLSQMALTYGWKSFLLDVLKKIVVLHSHFYTKNIQITILSLHRYLICLTFEFVPVCKINISTAMKINVLNNTDTWGL